MDTIGGLFEHCDEASASFKRSKFLEQLKAPDYYNQSVAWVCKVANILVSLYHVIFWRMQHCAILGYDTRRQYTAVS
jgi:hypothetical protein